MQKRGRGVFFAAGLALFALALLAAAQAPPAKPKPAPQAQKSPPPKIIEPAISLDETPKGCEEVRKGAGEILAELGGKVSPDARAEAEQYAAKPAPGSTKEKAWADFAAAGLLLGDAQVAAWASLKAAEIRWNGETVANTGIYFIHLERFQDAYELLTCAYEMGYRSPYLFEALAILHKRAGNQQKASQEIQSASEAAPDDPIIEVEKPLINNQAPPPPAPPRPTDGLDEAIRELEQHAQRALNLMGVQAQEIDSSIPDARSRQIYQISADYFAKLIQIHRDQARQARAAAPNVRGTMIVTTLSAIIGSYFRVTDNLLSFPDSTETNGSPLLVWADALGLDARNLARESRRDALGWAMHGIGPALAQGALDDFRRDKDAAFKEWLDRTRACRDNPCNVREKARYCVIWKQLFERWAAKNKQRHDTAARNFDRIATRTVIEAEYEIVEAREFAVHYVGKMRFPKAPPGSAYSLEQMTLQVINMIYKSLVEKHLGAAGSSGVVTYMRERARWYERERSSIDKLLAEEARDIQRGCEPAMRTLLELLAEEEWQAYLDHLRDRLAGDFDFKDETSGLPCEGSIGPATLAIDFAKGEGKFDLKWKKESGPIKGLGGGKAGVNAGVSVSYKQGEGFSIGLSGGVSGSTAGGDRASTGGTGGGGSSPGITLGGGTGPFTGKAKITLTNVESPWSNQEYLGIKIKGSAGLGFKKGSAGGGCYPSSGSVTFSPRAVMEDAMQYLSATSQGPPGGRR